jgi:hypothetical protein
VGFVFKNEKTSKRIGLELLKMAINGTGQEDTYALSL